MSKGVAGDAARLAGVDALRALALLPVVLVNFASYVTPLSAPTMLEPRPADSLLAILVTAFTAGLIEAKGVTLLSFLFGYSLVLGSRHVARLKRLLGLGLAHGLLLYFGDILGTYAVAGALALRRRRERLRNLLRRAVFWTCSGLLITLPFGADTGEGDATALGLGSLHQASGFFDWWTVNAQLYGFGWLALLVILPLTYGLVLLGICGARLRLLSHRRWRGRWQACARWAAPLLLLNLGYGLLQATQPLAGVGLTSAFALLTLPSWVSFFLLRQPPSLLAAAGRNTLTVYIGSSLLLVLLLSGAGLALPLGSAATVGLALCVWVLLLGWSARAAGQGKRLPLERWLARRPA
jgi:uncharacterized protein